MARLFGLIGNRPDLAGRVLAESADALAVRGHHVVGDSAPLSEGSPHAKTPLGWGLGFYQGGEVLMRRRPLDEHETVELAHLAADVRADVLIGHVRSATVGALRTENTHPFRYRQWLFAQTGTLDRFDALRERLLATVPGFLRGNIRGETDAELVFHVLLSFLHDAGKLDDGIASPEAITEALRGSLSVIDGMAAEVDAAPCQINLVVTNGEVLVAAHKADADGAKMYVRELSGKGDAEMILGEEAPVRGRAPELSRMHFVLVASDVDEDLRGRWKEVRGPSIVVATRADAPKIESL
jgi:predicted glutamine amidotransferase